MVKNKKGGSGHKKFARKKVNSTKYASKKLRLVKEEGEIYARITRIHGGDHAEIFCSDGKLRILVIRGKFRGRNKRDNTLKKNTIVIAGLRSVSFGAVVSADKKEKADLIYVYNDGNMKELKKIKAVYDILSDEKKEEYQNETGFNFTNNIEEELFHKEDKQENSKANSKENSKENKNYKIDNVEIDWDQI